MVWGLGFGVWESTVRVSSGFRVYRLGFRAQGVSVQGVSVQGLSFVMYERSFVALCPDPPKAKAVSSEGKKTLVENHACVDF
jgi:hypothetical protein